MTAMGNDAEIGTDRLVSDGRVNGDEVLEMHVLRRGNCHRTNPRKMLYSPFQYAVYCGHSKPAKTVSDVF